MNNDAKSKIKRFFLDGRLIGIVPILVSMIFIALSVTKLINSSIKDSNNVTVKATVVETFIEEEIDEDGVSTTMYFPVVEYVDDEGDTVRAMSVTGKKFNEYRKGDTLSVKINRDAPTSFEIVPFRTKYVLPVFLMLIGFACVGVGIWAIRSYIQNKNTGIFL